MPLASGPTPTKAQLTTLLRGFLTQVLPAGTEIVLGQANRVPEPTGDNFVCIIPTSLRRLATTVDTWAMVSSPEDTVLNHQQDVGAKIQLQAFGEGATDNLNIITTLLRSPYAVDFFAGSGIAPLYCDDGQQMPFINGEHQYEDRWICEAMFEMSINLATAQQFDVGITIGLVNVDVVYPPS